MDIKGSVALVTGANRGLGQAFAQRLLDRGATKVYATARSAPSVKIAGVEVIELDITDQAQVRAAAEVAPDVTLLVNNAGNNTWQNLVDGDLAQIRSELDTHFYGTLNMVRAFAPALKHNGGGAIVNILSAMSWFAYPGDNAYHVAKAAEWALTNSVRLELQAQHTLVTGVHLGLADTDMTGAFEGDKLAPAAVVDAALDGVESSAWEVLLDDWTRTVKAGLTSDPSTFYSAQS